MAESIVSDSSAYALYEYATTRNRKSLPDAVASSAL